MEKAEIKAKLQIYTLQFEAFTKIIEAVHRCRIEGMTEFENYFEHVISEFMKYDEKSVAEFDEVIQKDFDKLSADEDLRPLIIKYGQTKKDIQAVSQMSEDFRILSDDTLITNKPE